MGKNQSLTNRMRQAGNFMGIEIGGTKLQVVTGTADGTVLTHHRFEIHRAEGAKGIRDKIEQTVRENYSGAVAAVGIGFGGPVNWQTGQIATSFHVEGWSDFNLVEWLQPIVKCPVYIENDANVAALGEAKNGAGQEHQLVLYITIGSGIGGGLIINHEVYHGAIPGEVEIGHLWMNRSGDTFQSLCSGWGIDERIRKHVQMYTDSVLADLVKNRDKGEAAFLRTAVEQGDKDALRLFDDIIDDLCFGLSHAIHLFHPEIVVLGGGFSLTGDLLENAIRARLSAFLMKAFQPGPLISLARLKENSVPIGALLLASQRFQLQNT